MRYEESSMPYQPLEMMLLSQLQRAIPEATREELAELISVRVENVRVEKQTFGESGGSSEALGQRSGEPDDDAITYPVPAFDQLFWNLVGLTTHVSTDQQPSAAAPLPDWYEATDPFCKTVVKPNIAAASVSSIWMEKSSPFR